MKIKILLVDDRQDWRDTFKDILKDIFEDLELEIEIYESSNSDTAMEIICKNQDMHLAILDLRLLNEMKNLEGIDLVRKIEKMSLPSIKVILMTAYEDHLGDQEKSIIEEVDHFMLKMPCTIDSLANTIENLLNLES